MSFTGTLTERKKKDSVLVLYPGTVSKSLAHTRVTFHCLLIKLTPGIKLYDALVRLFFPYFDLWQLLTNKEFCSAHVLVFDLCA